jgi:hypothetical protein
MYYLDFYKIDFIHKAAVVVFVHDTVNPPPQSAPLAYVPSRPTPT